MATSGELSTLTELLRAWYRLTGASSSDDALIEQGETADDVAYLALTEGFRAVQAWMIDNGAKERWRKRSPVAIGAWSGSDTADGGRYVSLDTYCYYSVVVELATTQVPDFMRLDGNQQDRSALVQADGTPWGREVPADDDWRKGDYYYLRGTQLWLARTAAPPSVFLRYYYRHPAISSATTTFDMPIEARSLCVAEAAGAAVRESWVPGGAETEGRAQRALEAGRAKVTRTLLRTREPRTMQGPKRYASHW